MANTDSVRIETCPRHGLRYNAAAQDGCARCRKEAGQHLAAQPPRQLAPGSSPGDHAPMAGAVLLAAVLIAISGAAFHWTHAQVYAFGQRIMSAAQADAEELGEAFEQLGDAAEDFDPETAAQFREMGRHIREQGVPMDIESEMSQEAQERIRKQIEEIEKGGG